MSKGIDEVLEQHYTVPQIAARLGRSEGFVRQLFEGRPGVLTHGAEHRRGRRRYVTLLIPESVLKRVVQEMQR